MNVNVGNLGGNVPMLCGNLVAIFSSLFICVAGVFTKSYFAFWVFIALLWGLVATFVIIVLPLYESYDQIMMVLYGLMGYTYVPPAPPAPVSAPEPVIEMVEPTPAPAIEKAPEPE